MNFLIGDPPADPFLGVPYKQQPRMGFSNEHQAVEDMPIPENVDDDTFITSFFSKADDSQPLKEDASFCGSPCDDIYYPDTPLSMDDDQMNTWHNPIDVYDTQQYSSTSDQPPGSPVAISPYVYSQIPERKNLNYDEEEDPLEKALIETAKACDPEVASRRLKLAQNTLPITSKKPVIVYYQKALVQDPRCRLGFVQIPYAILIGLALKNGGKEEEAVRRIYAFVNANFQYYDLTDDRWKKSLRHCISTCYLFQKGDPNSDGTGFFWKFRPNGLELFHRKIYEFTEKNPYVHCYGLKRPEHWDALVHGEIGIPEVDFPLQASLSTVTAKRKYKVKHVDEAVPPKFKILYPVKVVGSRPPHLKDNTAARVVFHRPPSDAIPANVPQYRFVDSQRLLLPNSPDTRIVKLEKVVARPTKPPRIIPLLPFQDGQEILALPLNKSEPKSGNLVLLHRS